VVPVVAGLQHPLDVEAFASDVIPRQNVEMWSTKHRISAEVWKMEHSQEKKLNHRVRSSGVKALDETIE
jgi:hypothetical protein